MDYAEFINKHYIYLVVGVSQDKAKWGYRVWKQLSLDGFKAIPINPKYEEIEGEKCYGSIADWLHVTGNKLQANKVSAYAERFGEVIVVTVVPPEVTRKVVAEAVGLGIGKVWMQPGSEPGELPMVNDQCQIITGKCIVRDGLGEEFRV